MRGTRWRHLVLIAAAVHGAWFGSAAFGADAAPTQVMLVGTYHFSNANLDAANVKAVDVLAPER